MAHEHQHHGAVGDEAPLDAANQSLADALRASFSILKFIMFVLVVMYCFSGVQCVEENEQAVVLRFGKLLPQVREAGLSWAFPYPIDETLRFPTKRSNEFTCMGHWPKIKKGREAEPLNKSRGAGGLNPALDGALLTADSGMVHIQWVATYRVNDLRDYVLHVADQKTKKVEDMITALLENAAIHVVSRHSAEEVTRGKSTDIATAVRARLNEQLEVLDTGVTIVALEIPRSSVPGQTIRAFDEVTNAANERSKAIADARRAYEEMLYDSAGAAWRALLTHQDEDTGEKQIGLLDQRDAALAAGDAKEVSRLDRQIETLIEEEAGGDAGEAIRQAKGYFTEVIQSIRGDVEEYQSSLEQYLHGRELFVHRMWQRTRQRVLQREGVTKHILPEGVEIRIKVPPDPEQRRLDEMKRLEEEAEEYDYQEPKKLHGYVPDMPG